MKYSKQRALIEETVLKNHIHPTADDVYAILKPDNPNLSLGTVYRNLNNLAEQGIIKKVQIAGESDRFDSILENHDHIICEKCGKIFDTKALILSNLNQKINEEFGVKITSYNLIIKGICPNCQNKK